MTQSQRVLTRLSPRAWLPEGRALSEADFAWRHRVVTTLLALHVPVVLVLAVAEGRSPAGAALEIAPVVLLLGLALSRLPRQTRALSASLGLLTCSALLVYLTEGQTELHFHYFVAVAVVALYQDWVVYLLAIAFVGVQYLLFAGTSAMPAGAGAGFAVAQAAFVLAESAVLVVFWRASEQARHSQDQLRDALDVGRSSVRARIEDAERIRNDLIGTVSHEFRTPLTGIRGAALTLLKRGDRLDARAREELLHAVIEQQERLSRLLENMLTAARATSADAAAVAEVDAVAAEVAMLARGERPGLPAPAVVVEPGTLARIDRQALHQVLANLVDNAQLHGAPTSVPLVAGGRDGDQVWLAVSNEGVTLDETATERLFEPFTQLDTSSTRGREGAGMGLYVVRRLVEVYGGSVDVRSTDGWVTVEVRLASAGAPEPRRESVPAGRR